MGTLKRMAIIKEKLKGLQQNTIIIFLSWERPEKWCLSIIKPGDSEKTRNEYFKTEQEALDRIEELKLKGFDVRFCEEFSKQINTQPLSELYESFEPVKQDWIDQYGDVDPFRINPEEVKPSSKPLFPYG